MKAMSGHEWQGLVMSLRKVWSSAIRGQGVEFVADTCESGDAYDAEISSLAAKYVRLALAKQE